MLILYLEGMDVKNGIEKFSYFPEFFFKRIPKLE